MQSQVEVAVEELVKCFDCPPLTPVFDTTLFNWCDRLIRNAVEELDYEFGSLEDDDDDDDEDDDEEEEDCHSNQ